MSDIISKMLARTPGFVRALFDHNRFTGAALVIASALIVNLTGCQPTVNSPLSGKAVTQSELTAEVEARRIETAAEADRLQAETDALINQLKAKYKAREVSDAVINARLGPAYEELKRKQDAIHVAVDMLGTLVAGSGSPWAGTALSIGGLLLAGLGLDNRRKDRVIQQRVEPATVLASTTVSHPVAVQQPPEQV